MPQRLILNRPANDLAGPLGRKDRMNTTEREETRLQLRQLNDDLEAVMSLQGHPGYFILQASASQHIERCEADMCEPPRDLWTHGRARGVRDEAKCLRDFVEWKKAELEATIKFKEGQINA